MKLRALGPAGVVGTALSLRPGWTIQVQTEGNVYKAKPAGANEDTGNLVYFSGNKNIPINKTFMSNNGIGF